MNSKSKYNPRIHHRRSIRLKGYDYSQKGFYFITICIQNRKCLFGRILNGEMILNDAGKMIEKWYSELENKFNDILCHEKIVMPNHFHCIIENVGADLRVLPNNDLRVRPNGDFNPIDDSVTLQDSISLDDSIPIDDSVSFDNLVEHVGLGEHVGSPLHRVMQWFKTMSTNEYIRNVKLNNWQPFDGKLWQRNYYERIIWNEKSYHNVSNYIIKNPLNWNNDSINPNNNKKQ